MTARVEGADPALTLRSVAFAAHRDDPRYKRLLVMAGFDKKGALPTQVATP